MSDMAAECAQPECEHTYLSHISTATGRCSVAGCPCRKFRDRRLAQAQAALESVVRQLGYVYKQLSDSTADYDEWLAHLPDCARLVERSANEVRRERRRVLGER